MLPCSNETWNHLAWHRMPLRFSSSFFLLPPAWSPPCYHCALYPSHTQALWGRCPLCLECSPKPPTCFGLHRLIIERLPAYTSLQKISLLFYPSSSHSESGVLPHHPPPIGAYGSTHSCRFFFITYWYICPLTFFP